MVTLVKARTSVADDIDAGRRNPSRLIGSLKIIRTKLPIRESAMSATGLLQLSTIKILLH